MDIIKYGASYRSITSLAANTPETVFSAAANVRGAIVWDASFVTENSTGNAGAYLAKTSAPANETDGDAIVTPSKTARMTSVCSTGGKLAMPTFIPAGKGLYFISKNAETAGVASRSALYTLL